MRFGDNAGADRGRHRPFNSLYEIRVMSRSYWFVLSLLLSILFMRFDPMFQQAISMLNAFNSLYEILKSITAEAMDSMIDFQFSL